MAIVCIFHQMSTFKQDWSVFSCFLWKHSSPHLGNRLSPTAPFVTLIQPTAPIKQKESPSYKTELQFFQVMYSIHTNDRFADVGNAGQFLGLENVPSHVVGDNLNQTSTEAPSHI